MTKKKTVLKRDNTRVVAKIFETINKDREDAFKTFSEFSKTLAYIDVETNPDAYAKASNSLVKVIEAMQKSTQQMIDVFGVYSKSGDIDEGEIEKDFYDQLYSNETVEMEPSKDNE